jgi:glucokinase
MIDAIAGYVAELSAGELPLGVSVAGTVAADGRLSLGSHIHWDAASFSDQLEQHHHGRVRIVNDGEATALGEFVRRGPEAAPLLAVSVGTGLGGGLITDRGNYRGGNAMSLEIGHLIVEPSGRPCRCSGHGCLQAYASGWAIGETFRDRRGLPGTVAPEAVVAAAVAGDSVAAAVLAEAGGWLGLGLASIVAIVDPRVIVLTGGLVNAGEILLAPARRVFDERVFGGLQRILTWEGSRCGGHSALVGAATAAGFTSLDSHSISRAS